MEDELIFANKADKAACIEQMEREIQLYGISSWKWYCHTDPGQSGNGFQLDDDNARVELADIAERLDQRFRLANGTVHDGLAASRAAGERPVGW